MILYKAPLNWKDHVKHCQMTLLLVTDEDGEQSAQPVVQPPIDEVASTVILKDEFIAWLRANCRGKRYLPCSGLEPHIYFEDVIDAIRFKMTWEDIGEIIEFEVDDRVVEAANRDAQ
jgi:hypothetical protein